MDSLRCGGSIFDRDWPTVVSEPFDRSNASGVASFGAKQVGPLW
ncbi:MAG: hypothetical protein VKK80_01490 [Prochlorothrix sp.]|nr:hypothetical protein [Prochlorothrix sp.]